MEFTSHFDQSYHMGYCPPPQNDSSHYPNDGWEYHQGMIDYEQSTPLGYAPGPQNDQENYMGYFPPPQNDSYHYTNGYWEYQQGMTEYEQSIEMGHIPGTQNYPYFDEFNTYSSCGWEDQNQRDFNAPHSIHQEPSSLERALNLFMQNCPTPPSDLSCQNFSSPEYASTQNSSQNPYNSFYQPQNLFHYAETSLWDPQNSFHTSQNNFTTIPTYLQNHSQPSSLELTVEQFCQRQEQSWKEQEILFTKIEGHLEQIKKNIGLLSKEDEDQFVGTKEELEEQEKEAHVPSEIPMKKEVVEAYEPRIPYPQRLLEVTKQHANSLPKEVMQATKEREKNNHGSPHPHEAESCMKDGFIEPSIQKALDEEDTLTNKQ
ncbi:hypothetical protein AHAS_Ahas17G0193600 [Arachis hypogaea]